MAEQFKATPNTITQHFNPAWFASVMGTAVIPARSGITWIIVMVASYFSARLMAQVIAAFALSDKSVA